MKKLPIIFACKPSCFSAYLVLYVGYESIQQQSHTVYYTLPLVDMFCFSVERLLTRARICALVVPAPVHHAEIFVAAVCKYHSHSSSAHSHNPGCLSVSYDVMIICITINIILLLILLILFLLLIILLFLTLILFL